MKTGSRNSPLPHFNLQILTNTDELTGRPYQYAVLSSNVNDDLMNGFITLDELEDIVLLRDYLNKTINKMKSLSKIDTTPPTRNSRMGNNTRRLPHRLGSSPGIHKRSNPEDISGHRQ